MVPAAPARPAPARPARSARVAVAAVLGAVAAVRLVGTVVFTFFTAPEDGGVGTAADRVFAAWSATMAVALLVAAVLLARDAGARARSVVVALLAADLVFAVAKASAYGEAESVLFGVVDVALLAAVLLLGRRR